MEMPDFDSARRFVARGTASRGQGDRIEKALRVAQVRICDAKPQRIAGNPGDRRR